MEAVAIKLPRDFNAVQERALSAVNSGTLQILSGSLGWSDFIECELACAHCAFRFHLDCETYHGIGGKWQPAESDSRS